MYNYRKICKKKKIGLLQNVVTLFQKKKKLIHTKYDFFSLAAVLQLELLTVQFMPLIDPCSVVHVSLEYFKLILTSRIKSLNPTLNVKH